VGAVSQPLKYAYGRISVSESGVVAEYVDSHNPAMRDFIAKQMMRATDDLEFMVADMDNTHIGPMHGPGRTECNVAWMHLRNVNALRALGRPAGRYRR
jgi:hypothetical protein